MAQERHSSLGGGVRLDAAGLLLPLCSRPFTDPDELSRERAPPANVGGCVIVLTCRGCNSTAGHSLDVAIRRHEDFREFHAGEHKRLRRGRMRVGDVEANALVNISRDGVRIVDTRSRNAPDVAMAIERELEDLRDDGKITVFVDDLRREAKQAYAGWLRAGYLAAFAALGWRWAALPELKPVRDQIARPDEEIVPLAVHGLRRTTGLRRSILIVDEPEELRSVAVAIDRYVVLLPPPFPPRDIYERVATLSPFDRETPTFAARHSTGRRDRASRPTSSRQPTIRVSVNSLSETRDAGASFDARCLENGSVRHGKARHYSGAARRCERVARAASADARPRPRAPGPI